MVDTLIEMQNEEVPLLVKKSVNGPYDKCGSCNQNIINNPMISSHNFYNNDFENSVKGRSMGHLHERAKTPNIIGNITLRKTLPLPAVVVQK